MRIIDAYLWGYKNPEAADYSFSLFKKFYPDGEIFIKVDVGGDIENYKKVAKNWNADVSENKFKIGYPGNHQEHNVGRECWPKECAILWCDNIYDACKKSDAKYMIILEEDSFIIKPISILKYEFGISVFPYNASMISETLMDLIKQVGGNINISPNIFGRRGYGAGGGFIVDCKKWIESWEKFKPVLEEYYDEIKNADSKIGWSDCLAQIVIMAGGHRVLQNQNFVQTWFENSPLYPNQKSWRDAEIVDYIKDLEIIKTHNMKLNELIDKYGSDKNVSKYTDAYMHFFEPIRNSVSSILEIGLGTIIPGAKSSMHDWRTGYVSDYKPGASLRVWQDYFPYAQVYGGDIQEDTQFTDTRIKTFLFNSQKGNECNESLKDLTFDIIIDDGDHDAISQVKTIYNLIGRVKPGGFYIIEDVTPGNAEIVIQFINPLIQAFQLESYLINPEKNLLILKFA